MEQTTPESSSDPFWDTPSGKGTISALVILSLVVIGLVIFVIVWFVTRNSSSSQPFNINWTSPGISGGVSAQTGNYTFDSSSLLVAINVPTATFAVAPNVNVFGLLAPGNSSFPSKLAYQNAGQNVYYSTTTAVSFGSTSGTPHTTIAVTATLYPDGSLSIVPIDGTTFFGTTNGTTMTIHGFDLSYNAGTNNPTLTYASLQMNFAGTFVAGGVASTTLYYSTFTQNGQPGTILALPSVVFSTNASVGSSLTSVIPLPTALRPTSNLSESFFSPIYNGGLPNSGTVAIDTSGNMTLTNTTGTFNANQVGCSFGFAGGFFIAQ